jgi:hypothetical protein
MQAAHACATRTMKPATCPRVQRSAAPMLAFLQRRPSPVSCAAHPDNVEWPQRVAAVLAAGIVALSNSPALATSLQQPVGELSPSSTGALDPSKSIIPECHPFACCNGPGVTLNTLAVYDAARLISADKRDALASQLAELERCALRDWLHWRVFHRTACMITMWASVTVVLKWVWHHFGHSSCCAGWRAQCGSSADSLWRAIHT